MHDLIYCRLYYTKVYGMAPRLPPTAVKGKRDAGSLTMQTKPERAPIDTLLPYLLTCPEANVKELIARNLANRRVLQRSERGALLGDGPDRLFRQSSARIILSEAIDRLAKLAPVNQ